MCSDFNHSVTFRWQHMVSYSMASHCTCHKDISLNLMMKHVMPVQITMMLSALSFFSCLCKSKSRMSICSPLPVKVHGCPDKTGSSLMDQ